MVTIAIGLAALNTGHNLFYLVFAMLVSLIVVFGPAVRARGAAPARRAAAVRRRCSRAAPPLRAPRAKCRVGKRASYAVEIRDGVAGQPATASRLSRSARSRRGALVRLALELPRRGRQSFRSVHLVTRFPFGLFEKTRIVRGGRVVRGVSRGGGRGRAAPLPRSGPECVSQASPRRGGDRASAQAPRRRSTPDPLAGLGADRRVDGHRARAARSTVPLARLLRQPRSGGRSGSRRPWSAPRRWSGRRAATGRGPFPFIPGADRSAKSGPRQLRAALDVSRRGAADLGRARAGRTIASFREWRARSRAATEAACSSRRASRRSFRRERCSEWPAT